MKKYACGFRLCLRCLVLSCLLLLPAIVRAQEERPAALTEWLQAQRAAAEQDSVRLKSILQQAKEYGAGGSLDSAEDLFRISAEVGLAQKRMPVFIESELGLGRVSADRGNNVQALEHYQRGLRYAETIGNKQLIAHLYKHIGALYISWKKLDEALGYYDRAEQMAQATGDIELVADCQNNKGTAYEQLERYEEATKAYKRALDIYTEKDIPGKIAMALSNVAIVYKAQKNYTEALAYNFKAIALSEKTGDDWMRAATYNNIGSLYCAMGDYKNAIAYGLQALEIAQKLEALELIECIYDSLSEAAAKAGDYKRAYEWHCLYSTANREFINKENTRQLSELNIRYETEKKQQLIREQQLAINKKNYWIAGIAMLLVFTAVTAFLLVRDSRYKRQQAANQALFEGEQNERIRIARDLHDSVGQMLTVVRIKLSAESVSAAAETAALLDQAIGEVRTISHNLIPEELNFGLVAALESMADRVNAAGATHMEVDIADALQERQWKKEQELSLYRIAQEVLSNMIRHAAASKIVLRLAPEGQGIVLEIRDNGKGMKAGSVEQSTGIGWKNVKARVGLLAGELKISSEKQTGTTVAIHIPGSTLTA